MYIIGPLPPPEKRWEAVLSSTTPSIAENGMAIAQELLDRGQRMCLYNINHILCSFSLIVYFD
jgi:hypothetical protein